MTRKLSQEQIETAFSAEGYTLLDRYQSAHVLMAYKCPQGHQHQITWANFQGGRRCVKCHKLKPSKRRLDPQIVRSAFEAEGYTLLDEYETSVKKMRYICPAGHQHSMDWGHFKTGVRCAGCNSKVVTHEQVQAAFEAASYQLLDRYERNCQKLRFICPQNHSHSITWAAFNGGGRCGHCRGRVNVFDRVKKAFKQEGYTLLSTSYANAHQKLEYICPEGHQHQATWNYFQQGGRCPSCAGFGLEWTEERLALKKIRQGIHKAITKRFRRFKAGLPVSKSEIAGKIAIEIYNHLGVCPEGYQLDHIVPTSYFDCRNLDEVEACWSIVNLRYLPAEENRVRGNKLAIEEVEVFTDEQLKVLASASKKPDKWKRYIQAIEQKAA